MRLLFVLWAAMMLAAGAGQAQSGYPALHAVVGVAGDDVLNIRRDPSGSAPVIGSLGPHQTGVEVTGADDSGKWLRVNTQESSGWAAARFLERAETADYAFARALNCFGTEPFWSLDIVQGSKATLSRMDGQVLSFGSGLMRRGEGRTDRWLLGFGQGLLVAAQRSCGDGMSDRHYALDASVVLVEQGMTLYSGCCSIQPE